MWLTYDKNQLKVTVGTNFLLFSQRKKTLLQEFRIKDKSNRFLDRRIGEKNSAMTAEDRIMARFTVERMKMHNKVIIFMRSGISKF